jgi:hypothetical protein
LNDSREGFFLKKTQFALLKPKLKTSLLVVGGLQIFDRKQMVQSLGTNLFLKTRSVGFGYCGQSLHPASRVGVSPLPPSVVAETVSRTNQIRRH